MSDKKPRENCLLILLRILAHPYKFSRKELAEYFKVSKDVVDDCIEVFRNVDLHFDQDRFYNCAILTEKGFSELDRLQPLNDSDKLKIKRALDYIKGDDSDYIWKKIESLVDFQQLGLRALRRPELDKLDVLERAKREKKRIRLINYHSNSNEIKNRVVECFYIDTSAGMLQVYDYDKREVRHFKLSRVERVELLEDMWAHESEHYIKYTDVFRIADNERVPVHLELNTFGYNSMIDLFPQATSRILPSNEPNKFDFQDKVNHKFLGVKHFILSNAMNVKIINPPALIAVIRNEAEGILSTFNEE